tara:strand:- start:134 stop:577 length:444 start_codon:yes stop_codon:yes gene_type:complete
LLSCLYTPTRRIGFLTEINGDNFLRLISEGTLKMKSLKYLVLTSGLLTLACTQSATAGQYYVPQNNTGYTYYVPQHCYSSCANYVPAYRPGAYIQRTRTIIIIQDHTRYYLPAPSQGHVYLRYGRDAYYCQPYQGQYIVKKVYASVF